MSFFVMFVYHDISAKTDSKPNYKNSKNRKFSTQKTKAKLKSAKIRHTIHDYMKLRL